ncbi:hypothetical protein V5799_005877 [Amblyomma americanum]|uniref:Uncharacterized protein n=1 Tax=Amblyomma americanum TaxID=6943 RepID=A0AAQ4DXZ7_AMBAM
MYLRRSLLDNSLLHFYITDEELYSYQCGNRNSCTYKLCNPETSQEKTLTKRWHGRCPLLPGFYEYKFVYKLPPRILHTKRKTTVLNIQAQLHEGYVCVACYKIRMMFRKKTKV